MSLLEAMRAGCEDTSPEDCQGWIRHSRRFFPRCMARENIRCDVDENLWPDAREAGLAPQFYVRITVSTFVSSLL